jgi:hypothetical protein
MHVLSTACPWRCIPKNLPPRDTLHDYIDWLPFLKASDLYVCSLGPGFSAGAGDRIGSSFLKGSNGWEPTLAGDSDAIGDRGV